MNSQQAYDAFWQSFGWEAWKENTVPDNALKDYGHYITYRSAWAGFGNAVMLSASIWERSNSWKNVTEKADEIAEAIGFGGKVIPFDGGGIWIKRGTPFSQPMDDEDTSVRRLYLNIEVEYFTNV